MPCRLTSALGEALPRRVAAGRSDPGGRGAQEMLQMGTSGYAGFLKWR